MADSAEHSSSQTGMDMAEHVRTWHGFLKVTKWSIAAILLIMAFMAIFRVH